MKKQIFLLCLLSKFYLFAELLEPYASLKTVYPEYNFGWFCPDTRDGLSDLFAENDIRVVVEVGSWMGGGSTRHIAELLKKNQGTLYSVDTWCGNIIQQPGQQFYDPHLIYAYEQFLSNMIHWGLTDIVIPYRMTSLEAAKIFNLQPDLIYIDAEHTVKAVLEDLNAWYPFVKDKGIICGDDFGYDPESREELDWDVQRAVELFAAENDLILETKGVFWRLRKRNL